MRYRIIHKKVLPLFFLLLLSILGILPLLNSGFIVTDDGDWMVVRFSAFYHALSDGQFPVRWLSRLNHSFGYPVANFLYPGFMYLAVPFKLFGLTFIDSVKAVIIGSMIGSAVFCFFWLRHHFSSFASMVGGLLYLFLPYHIYDLYQRGSVGELLALSIVPFVLWQVRRKSFFLTSLGIGFLILSHNTLALLFFPVILMYMFLQKDFRSRIVWYVSNVSLGVLSAGFFWIPALYDLQYTVFFETTVSEWSSYFANISLVGLSVILVFASVLYVLLTKKQTEKKYLILFFVLGLTSLFLSTHISSFLWEFLPISFIQFPFRILSLLLLSTAFISGWVVDHLTMKRLRYGFTIVVVLLLFPSFVRIANVETRVVSDESFSTNEDTTTVQNEYMPVWVDSVAIERPEAFLTIGDSQYGQISRPTTNIDVAVDVRQSSTVTYNQLYFPGWSATVDGHPVNIEPSPANGTVQFPIEEGSHNIRVFFEETPVRLFADIVSLTSALFIIGVSLFSTFKTYGNRTKTQ